MKTETHMPPFVANPTQLQFTWYPKSCLFKTILRLRAARCFDHTQFGFCLGNQSFCFFSNSSSGLASIPAKGDQLWTVRLLGCVSEFDGKLQTSCDDLWRSSRPFAQVLGGGTPWMAHRKLPAGLEPTALCHDDLAVFRFGWRRL